MTLVLPGTLGLAPSRTNLFTLHFFLIALLIPASAITIDHPIDAAELSQQYSHHLARHL